MKLREADGKNIRVTFIDGSILSGKGDCYTPAPDNPEGKASLCIGDAIFFEDEVDVIEEIK